MPNRLYNAGVSSRLVSIAAFCKRLPVGGDIVAISGGGMIFGLGGLKSLHRFLGGLNRLFREFLLGANDMLGEFFKSWGG